MTRLARCMGKATRTSTKPHWESSWCPHTGTYSECFHYNALLFSEFILTCPNTEPRNKSSRFCSYKNMAMTSWVVWHNGILLHWGSIQKIPWGNSPHLSLLDTVPVPGLALLAFLQVRADLPSKSVTVDLLCEAGSACSHSLNSCRNETGHVVKIWGQSEKRHPSRTHLLNLSTL